MQVNGGGGTVGGRIGGRRGRGVAAMADINVTPFVDVVLVLLIIFMITAHVMESGIEVDVPKTKSVQQTTKDLPVVTINRDGNVFLGNDAINFNLLASQIRSKYPGQNAVYLKADAQTPFDPVAQVMSALGTAKFAVNVVTRPDDGNNRDSRRR